MRFALSTEQQDFASSLREQLAGSAGAVRAWSRDELEPGRKLLRGLADTGVTGLTIEENHGGLGAHPVDLVVGFIEIGRAAAPGPLIESVAVAPTLLAPFGDLAEKWLPGIADGSSLASVASPRALDADVCDLVLRVNGSRIEQVQPGTRLNSVDTARRLFEVTDGSTLVEDPAVPQAWDRAFDLAALACSAQLLGLGRHLVDTTTEYAKGRVQFGKPIGSFQAIKHQLADALIGLEMAMPLIYGAAISIADGSEDASRDVSAAKVASAEAAYRASRVALQVHGAIGYTAEYDLSLWLTKVRALYTAWGTVAAHRARIAHALAAV